MTIIILKITIIVIINIVITIDIIITTLIYGATWACFSYITRNFKSKDDRFLIYLNKTCRKKRLSI